MVQSLITVNNVSKSYGGVKANVDISMTVKQGSITGIIGPNGCGKTTLFNSIVAIIRLTLARSSLTVRKFRICGSVKSPD